MKKQNIHFDTASLFEKAGEAPIFLPIGGVDEIGANFSLYGYKGRWLIVDYGIGFADKRHPGVEIITPDFSVLSALKGKIDGIVITHAHEDHIGGLTHAPGYLKGVPLICTAFAAAVIERKFADYGTEAAKNLLNIRPTRTRRNVQLGAFNVELYSVSHSIPEACSVAIRTAGGTLLHSGDWKQDAKPGTGSGSWHGLDEDGFRALGEEGVLALMCDSTNILNAGASRSESEAAAGLKAEFEKAEGRILVTCFSTNVSRLAAIAEAAAATERTVCAVGRSIWRIYDAAKSCGYLQDTPPFIEAEDATHFPDKNLVLICTGSQGEPRAAMSRIASGQHRDVKIQSGDTILYSSRDIPGNEQAIGAAQNALAQLGARIVTSDQACIHVTGHPKQDEVRTFLSWVQPASLIPVHGERRHLEAHAKFAQMEGIPHITVPKRGQALALRQDGSEIIDEISCSHRAIDGLRVLPIQGGVLKERLGISREGLIFVSLAINGRGQIADDVFINAPGLLTDSDDERVVLEDIAFDCVESLSAAARKSDERIERELVSQLKSHCRKVYGKKPHVHLHILRV